MLLSMQFLEVNILISCNFVIFKPKVEGFKKDKVFYELMDNDCVGDYVDVFYEEMTLTEEGYFEVIVDSIEASDLY
ncbi:MAG: hypothetical protein K0R00_1768 [Herbinix sp.]|nr:hypothetical protein [Herbinix sp.]